MPQRLWLFHCCSTVITEAVWSLYDPLDVNKWTHHTYKKRCYNKAEVVFHSDPLLVVPRQTLWQITSSLYRLAQGFNFLQHFVSSEMPWMSCVCVAAPCVLQKLDEALKAALRSDLEDVSLALLKTPAHFDASELRRATKVQLPRFRNENKGGPPLWGHGHHRPDSQLQ